MNDMSIIRRILLKRLKEKGIEANIVPGFISNLANTISFEPQMNLLQINKRLHFLGWDDFELDYHTLQLATALLETEGLKDLEIKSNPIL